MKHFKYINFKDWGCKYISTYVCANPSCNECNCLKDHAENIVALALFQRKDRLDWLVSSAQGAFIPDWAPSHLWVLVPALIFALQMLQ